MSLTELLNLLKGISGFETKVVYRAWPEGEAPALPYICFMEIQSNNFVADAKVFQKFTDVDIELYSANKDTTSEGLIEAALDSACIVWEKDETYIDTEQCYQIVYSITI